MVNKFKVSESAARQRNGRIGAPHPRLRPAMFATAMSMNEISHRLEAEGVARVYSDRERSARADAKVRPVGGWAKRAFDIVVASTALIILAPLLVAIAVAVRLDSPGKSIFRQERGGFDRKTFYIWKFRSMRVTENRHVVQARRGDARVTRLGAWLRRLSWDELPQLVNVLKGDMSIIGPRPHALEHDAQFEKVDPRYALRFAARPGVTGLAQVNGCRGPTETEEKIRARTSYDAEYVRTWSFWSDIRILFATVVVLFWKDDPGAL